MGSVYSFMGRETELTLEAVITPTGSPPPNSSSSQRVAYCFSGGGTRAYSCTLGYLRALHYANALRPEDFLSCVSGGSWACNAFAFGAAEETVLLGGPPIAPSELTLALLNTMEEGSMGHAAVSDVVVSLMSLAASEELSQVWLDAIAKVFLEPFGITEDSFTTDEQAAAEILQRNPGLGKLIWPRSGRPQPVTNVTLIGPAAAAPFKSHDLLPLEICPEFTGVAGTHDVKYHGESTEPEHTIGGFVESFAFGSRLSTRDGGSSSVTVSSKQGFPLKQAVGFSSAAFAVAAESLELTSRLAPYVEYWAPDGISPEEGFENTAETTKMLCGDGGSVENFGVIPMLRRQMSRIVVFVNTSTALSLEMDPSNSVVQMGQLDMYIPGLFGVPLEGVEKGSWLDLGMDLSRNHVFDNQSNQFGELVAQLQHKKSNGLPVTAQTTLTVLPNQFWGLPGGQEVDVLWVYLETASSFLDELTPELKSLVMDPAEQEFQRFPHYETVHQNSGMDMLSLTMPQVNLLSHFCSWVCEQGGVLEFVQRPAR